MATKADSDNPELLTTMNAIGYHGQLIEATEKHQLFAFDDASIKLLLQLDIAPTRRARCGISVKLCAKCQKCDECHTAVYDAAAT